MQQRAVIWISGAFHTLPTTDIEAISGLIPIHLYLKKLYDRFYLREFLLPSNYIIKSIIKTNRPNDQIKHQTKHCLSINSLMLKQVLCLSNLLIDMDNRCNKFLPSFSLFNKEFSPGNHLCDIFSNQFSFNP